MTLIPFTLMMAWDTKELRAMHLITLAADPHTPSEEARNAAMKVVEMFRDDLAIIAKGRWQIIHDNSILLAKEKGIRT